MKLTHNILKWLFLALFSLTIHIGYAACTPGQCAFSLDLKRFDVLKNNPNIAAYKIQVLDKHSAKAVGKLKNGNLFEIQQTAGDIWVMHYRTTIASTSKHPLSEKGYWLKQAIAFAKLVFNEKQYQYFKQDIDEKRFVLQPAVKDKLLFERYSEGNYQSISISQKGEQTIIELQQTAD